jgi:hypothetical protein
MLSSFFDSDLDRDLISDDSIFFMYLKLYKLVPDFQSLSRGRLKKILQDVQVQSYRCQFTDIFSLIIAIFLDYFIEDFLGGDSD